MSPMNVTYMSPMSDPWKQGRTWSQCYICASPHPIPTYTYTHTVLSTSFPPTTCSHKLVQLSPGALQKTRMILELYQTQGSLSRCFMEYEKHLQCIFVAFLYIA